MSKIFKPFHLAQPCVLGPLKIFYAANLRFTSAKAVHLSRKYALISFYVQEKTRDVIWQIAGPKNLLFRGLKIGG